MFEIDTAGFFRDLEGFLAAQAPAPLSPVDRAARALLQAWPTRDAFWRICGTEVTGVEVAEYLVGALHILERDGWHQGHYQDHRTGARCIRAVLLEARKAGYGDFDTSCLAERVLELILCSATGARTVLFVDWNDAPERTFAEVKALFEDGIEFARLYGPPPNAAVTVEVVR
ncbi:hypothetical protein [Streptomyces syringium]|uniref:DUF6197 family protein n=1 Tax=Streptomyces syringium TaxID=76729 RepID=UPI003AAD4EA5